MKSPSNRPPVNIRFQHSVGWVSCLNPTQTVALALECIAIAKTKSRFNQARSRSHALIAGYQLLEHDNTIIARTEPTMFF
ncbi:MAG: hypothetical protein EBE86_013580 [Hormoscilla sp. GUM202]|nr:hypothetical protein [Hormoscilla sp. GUM202]